MARVLTVLDGRAIMALLVKQATGQQNVSITDGSSFVSAGERVMATGMENTLNSLNILMNDFMVANRPYTAKLTLMDAVNHGVYSSRFSKTSFMAKDPKSTGWSNTDQYKNFAAGFTAGQNPDAQRTAQSTKSQWEQNPPIPVTLNFGGSTEWQNSITLYEDKIQSALRNESEWLRFLEGYITEHQNDIESQREAWNRLVLLNKIASVYDMTADMPGSVVNLTAGFNAKYGTSYTSAQLRTTYYADFLKYFVAEFKKHSKRLTERSKNYHYSPSVTQDGVTYNSLLRHTPYADQRVYLYQDFFIDAEAQVLPEIFNPEYLDIKTQYQEVNFWQGESNRPAINFTPAVINTTTGVQKAGANVSLEYVLGGIFDKDGLMTDFQLERANTTPLEARKGYRNTWLTIRKNAITDNTENSVIFIMAD